MNISLRNAYYVQITTQLKNKNKLFQLLKGKFHYSFVKNNKLKIDLILLIRVNNFFKYLNNYSDTIQNINVAYIYQNIKHKKNNSNPNQPNQANNIPHNSPQNIISQGEANPNVSNVNNQIVTTNSNIINTNTSINLNSPSNISNPVNNISQSRVIDYYTFDAIPEKVPSNEDSSQTVFMIRDFSNCENETVKKTYIQSILPLKVDDMAYLNFQIFTPETGFVNPKSIRIKTVRNAIQKNDKEFQRDLRICEYEDICLHWQNISVFKEKIIAITRVQKMFFPYFKTCHERIVFPRRRTR